MTAVGVVVQRNDHEASAAVISKTEWIDRELAKLDALTPSQQAFGRRIKKDLADATRSRSEQG